MYIFSRKIICKQCGRRFKGKNEHGKRIYICSTYSNYGKDKCERNAIEESELLEKVNKHMELTKLKMRRMGEDDNFETDLRSHVDQIERREDGYTIFYSDGTKTEVGRGYIKY